MFSGLPFNFMFIIMMFSGTLVSISSTHWLNIWIGLEVNLIGFLPLIMYMKSIVEGESAVKYFITQAMGSAFVILGSLLAFTLSFSWDMSNFNLSSSTGIWILLSGLMLKLGLFPFHYWLPSVMAGMSWFSCLILATWQKLAPLFLFICLLDLSLITLLPVFLSLIAMGSSMVSGIGGINQTQLRALLAYSSIGHLGWMVFSAMMSEWTLKIYLMIYILISSLLFMSLWVSNFNFMKDLSNMQSLNSYCLWVLILLLSLAGLPPLLGFIAKMVVILVSVGGPWFMAIPVMIIGSLMSLFYYLGLFFCVFLSFGGNTEKSFDVTNFSGVVMMVFVFMNLLGGLGLVSMNWIYFI